MRMALQWDASKYARMERDLCQRADLITAITPRDADAFRSDAPGKPVCVLPPGYTGEIPAGPPREITAETPRSVVLAGAFEWLAKRRNLEAFLHAAAGPFQQAKIGFQIVGKADPAWFAELANQHPWAKFEANVPSVTPYLDQARIGLIPMPFVGPMKMLSSSILIEAPVCFNACITALSACVESICNPFTAMGPAIAPATNKNAAPLQSPSTV